MVINNNNNIAFLSQASWGRLEMKPTRHKGHGSGTLIALDEQKLFNHKMFKEINIRHH